MTLFDFTLQIMLCEEGTACYELVDAQGWVIYTGMTPLTIAG